LNAIAGFATKIDVHSALWNTTFHVVKRTEHAMAGPKLIKSLERGLRVLQALQMQPDSSLQELYVFTGISKPSLLRILHTLARSGVVTRRLADGRYRIGATLSRAPSRREHRDRIAEAAAPVLERLCQRVSWPSDLMVPAGDHMEIRETSRARSPILLQEERVGLQVNWLLTGVGRAYLAYCPAKERQQVIEMLRASNKAEDRLARDPARLNAILAEVRARGYATRDPIHVGGWYGKPPHADGLISIAIPLRDGARVLGSINIVWLRTAFSVEAFAAQHLGELQDAAAEIVSSLRSRKRR
jgi:IclR family transcriptional regulator, mhp operon transcriptional activator